MREIVAVALGGAAGSIARYLVGGWVQHRASAGTGWIALFPAGTLVVNGLGCLVVGFLATLFGERVTVDPAVRTFALIGLVGGFTTFSTFGFETIELARGGNFALAAANVAVSVALGLAGVWLGAAAARAL